jgi:hypothetical protein
MSAGPDNQPLASPGNFFPSRQGRVAELFTELFGRSFLPSPYLAAVDNYIMRVALALDLNLAKFDQSCSHFSIFRCLDLQGNDAVIRVYDEAGNVIETHEHKGNFKEWWVSRPA